MNKAAKYAVSGLCFVALVTLVSWPFLDPAGRRGVVIAGAVALPIQVTALWALLRFRGQLNGFLARVGGWDTASDAGGRGGGSLCHTVEC